jgi:Flp pilus assembly protein TadD
VLDTYGWILHLSGRHSEARVAIEKALALAPDNAEIQGHLETVKQAM